MTVAIETHGLTKEYGSRTGLAGLDLEVRQGEIFGFLGPNGAGKTTTIRLLLDLIRPTAGEARVLGVEPRTGGAALRQRIGYLAGDFVVEGGQSARELLTFLGNLRGGVPSGRIDALAERLGLDLRARIRSLSKGNRQKVGLIQAFMHEPELLILDEPSSGLDPLVQQAFLAVVSDARAAGSTVFMSSHVLSEVERSADRVGVIREGRLIAVESVHELRTRAARRIEIEFESPVPLEAFSGLAGVEQLSVDGSVVRCLQTGRADALVKAASRYPVLTLRAEEPDLEEFFFSMYRAEETSHAQ